MESPLERFNLIENWTDLVKTHDILFLIQTTTLSNDRKWEQLAFLFTLSALFGIIGIYTMGMNILSNHWPSINGKVKEYSTSRETGYKSDYGLRDDAGAGTVRIYYWRIHLVIEYFIAGQKFTKKKKTLFRFKQGGSGFGDETTQAQVQKWFPIGTEIPVYYNPKRSRQAVFFQGFQMKKIWYLLIALFFYMVGIYLVLTPTDLFLIIYTVSFLFVYFGILKLYIELSKRKMPPNIEIDK